jgi:hypothetical protein
MMHNKVFSSGAVLALLIGLLSLPRSLSASEMTTVARKAKVVYVNERHTYAVLNRGGQHGVKTGTNACLLNEEQQPLFCSPVTALTAFHSALWIPREFAAKIAVGQKATVEVQAKKYIYEEQETSEKDDYPEDATELMVSPFFVEGNHIFAKDKDGKQQSHETTTGTLEPGLTLGYLYTLKSPITYHPLTFKPPVSGSRTSALWTQQKALATTDIGAFASYTFAPGAHKFNLSTDLYFRLLKWNKDEQNFSPSTSFPSYAETIEKFYTVGMGVDVARTLYRTGRLSLTPSVGAALEVSRGTLDATAVVEPRESTPEAPLPATTLKFTALRSTAVGFIPRIGLSTALDLSAIDVSLGINLTFGQTLSKSIKGTAEVPRYRGIIYTDDITNDAKKLMDHKASGLGSEIRLGIKMKV